MAWNDEDAAVELAARHHEAVELLAEAAADRRELAEQLERLRARTGELELVAQSLSQALEDARTEILRSASATPPDAKNDQGNGLFGLFRRGS